MADIKETIAVEKRLNRQGRGALKDILGTVIAEYNKFCSNKRHRIDSTRRSLIYNLFFNLHSETLSIDFLGTIGILIWPGFSSTVDVTVTRLRCPDEAIQMLHDHYDLYKHEVSGHDFMISDWVFPVRLG